MEYKPFTIESRNLLEPFFHSYGEGSCQHSFVSSFCMSVKYGDEFCIKDGFLFVHRSLKDTDSERIYLFPLGDLSRIEAAASAVKEVLSDAACYGKKARFETITGNAAFFLEKNFPDSFVIEENRDYSEYIYTHDRLSELQGHEMASKRYDIRTFERDYEGRFEVKKIETPEQIEEIRPFQKWWLEEKFEDEEDVQLDLEDISIAKGLDHFFELGLSGIIVYIDGKISGYAYGSPLSSDYYDVLIEKGDRNIRDIYRILNRDLVRLCCDGIAYINREEDLGNEGLRKAKMSYKPDFFIQKFIAREAVSDEQTQR